MVLSELDHHPKVGNIVSFWVSSPTLIPAFQFFYLLISFWSTDLSSYFLGYCLESVVSLMSQMHLFEYFNA